jgi:predicted transcriptional regulator YdeE
VKFQIKREIIIAKSASEVFQIISNMLLWNAWSPWMHCEPTAKTEFSGNPYQVGQSQTWKGEVIGSGRMTIENLKPDSLVQMKLEFLSPFAGVSQSTFEIIEGDKQDCKVIWTMDSGMPWFMFFFKKTLEAYMGSDFERGLFMLKQMAETGVIPSKSTYQGVKKFAAFQVVGKKLKCKISELPTYIPQHFEKLNRLISGGQLPQPQTTLALTHKFDIQKGTCELTVGCSYSIDKKVSLPQGYDLSKFPEHQAMLVDHYGTYRNLRNPWAMAMAYQRVKQKKVSSKIPVYEMYVISPEGRSEMEILTQIVVPLK